MAKQLHTCRVHSWVTSVHSGQVCKRCMDRGKSNCQDSYRQLGGMGPCHSTKAEKVYICQVCKRWRTEGKQTAKTVTDCRTIQSARSSSFLGCRQPLCHELSFTLCASKHWRWSKSDGSGAEYFVLLQEAANCIVYI